MHLSYAAGEETKTIKYTKNGRQFGVISYSTRKEQPSENPSDKIDVKLVAAALPQANPSSKQSKEVVDEATVKHNSPTLQIQQRSKDQQIQGTVRSQHKGHKKQKSMDFQQFSLMMANVKKISGQNQILKQKYKKCTSKEMNPCLRERNTVSQMKHYSYQSKKLNPLKKTILFNQSSTKKKTPKTVNEGDYKQIQRQLKDFIEQTPLQAKSKKKQHKKPAQKPYHHNSCSLNNKKNPRKFSKSAQIIIQSQLRAKKTKCEKYSFQKDSFSMPFFQNIISLFSNPTCVYNSRKELEIIKSNTPFIIPTEESVQQISQIREYENVRLRKKKSDSLRSLQKLTPQCQKNEENENVRSHSTLQIVKSYLQKFKEMPQQSQGYDLDYLSYIPEMAISKQIYEQLTDSLNLAQIRNISEEQNVRIESSEVVPLNPFLIKPNHQIGKLDAVIKLVQNTKTNNLEQSEKRLLLQKIKELMQDASGFNAKHLIVQEKRQQQYLQNIVQLNLSDSLKQSFKPDQMISQLNLDVLDKALRQRQAYLIQRKEKELSMFDQLPKNQDYSTILKWIDHQIKQVVNTRRQLWKGFYFANRILKDPEIEKNSEKRKKMMKCLSDKYIKNKSLGTLRKTEKPQKKEMKANDSVEEKKKELSKGKIGQSSFKKQKYIQSDSDQIDIRVSFQDSDNEELLITSQNQKQSSFEQIRKNTQQQAQVSKSFWHQHSNLKQEQRKETTALQSFVTGQVQRPQTIELNLLHTQCEQDYQDSQSQQQLNALTKESQNTKKESQNGLSLTEQEKEDVFEFIFLDLCIQLTDEYKNDSKVLQKIYTFIKTVKEQSKKQKGFKTSSNEVKQYIFQLISFLKTNTQLLSQVHTNIDKPLGPTALDILRYMHVYDEQPTEEQSNQTVFIIDLKVFEMFQSVYLSKLQFETYYQEEEKERKRRTFLKNAIHIHNKAIFDSLNQNLDKQRSFGLWGQPFSWKKTAKFYHQRTPFLKNNVILECAKKTIQSVAYMCGYMVDKQDSSFKGNPKITQTYIDQIREDRLSRMLANELQEGQEKMLFFDDEEAQLLVEVGLAVFQTLVAEAARLLLSLV